MLLWGPPFSWAPLPKRTRGGHDLKMVLKGSNPHGQGTFLRETVHGGPGRECSEGWPGVQKQRLGHRAEGGHSGRPPQPLQVGQGPWEWLRHPVA